MEPNASPLVAYGIGGLAVVMAFTAALGYGAAGRGEPRPVRDRKTGAALAAVTVWMVVTALLARTGALQRFDVTPPPMAVMMAAVLGGAFLLGLSRIGVRFAAGIPLCLLVAVQVFRLPLELLMRQAYLEGVMPVQLSMHGYNFDVVTGVLAIPVTLWVYFRPGGAKWPVYAWNVLGCAFLAVIAFVAIAGSPMVKAFGTEPENLNTWVLHFPFVWLPTVLVVFALAGHIVVFRALAREATHD